MAEITSWKQYIVHLEQEEIEDLIVEYAKNKIKCQNPEINLNLMDIDIGLSETTVFFEEV